MDADIQIMVGTAHFLDTRSSPFIPRFHRMDCGLSFRSATRTFSLVRGVKLVQAGIGADGRLVGGAKSSLLLRIHPGLRCSSPICSTL